MTRMNLARDRALTSIKAAQAIRDQFAAVTMAEWPSDKKVEFEKHMSDWTVAHQEFEAAKAEHETMSRLDAGLSAYTQATQAPFVTTAHQPFVQSVEQAKAARKNHAEAFRRFIRGGASALTGNEMSAYLASANQLFGGNARETLATLLPAEQLALVGTVDSLGGFLVPDDFMTELVKDLAGSAVMRPMCRVRPTAGNAATFMTVASGTNPYSSGIVGSFRGEGWVVGGDAIPVQNQPRFGRERVPVHIWAPDVIEITMELMADSAVNLDAEVRGLLTETRSNDEDAAFIMGTGVGQPMGIMQEVANGSITAVNSGSASTLTYEGLLNLFVSLPAQYRSRASWLFNSLTLGVIMGLKGGATGNDHPIFPVNTIPTQLFNRPIAISEFMPDVAGSAEPIVFGDFSYYGIADRMDMRIIRLVERYAPNVGILAVARVGGQTLKTSAFRCQTIST